MMGDNRAEELVLRIMKKTSKNKLDFGCLVKIAYLAERDYECKYNRKITGVSYIRDHFGPNSTRLESVIEESDMLKFTSTEDKEYVKIVDSAEYEYYYLSEEEIDTIDDTISKVDHLGFDSLHKLTHNIDEVHEDNKNKVIL